MSNHDFILKSGAKLHVSTAPFEAAITLTEAIKRAAEEFRRANPGTDMDQEIGTSLLTSPEVRKALYGAFPHAIYNNAMKVGPELFDDSKLGEQARGDYFEICERIIEVNARPFLSRTSSKSTATEPRTPGGHE